MGKSFGDYIFGLTHGAIVGILITILAVAASSSVSGSNDPAQYEFVTINGLSCLEVDNQIVSCNWDNWQK